ncbi:PepSY-associated TM helix domain-containing protein [Acinetobacter rathckeae]|uniref:PepSY-associated TM helix domain-containing protein n=1 Tax=Acinetobacter rathckeae TaxID=2605272 RepID=UPI0018A3234F|nr:PepSY-associated TM helix domain-containing protein [Acinetobacter rathckeae]MBF7686981.1 PepSY domain-containing protein [Acinetobacter rathckeae]MBF7694615.1 PepSY domain-containing protein [Acinetobacter rathckeae]
MYKSLRQSMAWLHSWTGLLLGWLLFAIFLTGSLSYYRHDITAWAQPAFHNMQTTQPQAIFSSLDYLQQHATDAQSWNIQVASTDNPINTIYWQKNDGSYVFKQLDPRTQQEINLLPTQGGDFFYNFHFQLFGVPIVFGRLLVSFAAFIMLIALISGVITHKKIFTDFFTLRTFKSQRSWLDFHNIVSVIALPFFFMITLTGLIMFFYLYLPSAIQKYYPQNNYDIFAELRSQTNTAQKSVQPVQMLTATQISQRLKQHWPDEPLIDSIEVNKPFTTATEIMIKQKQDRSITQDVAQVTFNAQGQVIADTHNRHPVATLYNGVYGLHLAPFAEPIIRVGLFFSGILGCFMVASGLLLWSLKRQIQNKKNTFHFGHYLVDRLNVSTFVGLPMAVLCYFYANRIITLPQLSSTNQEIFVFFSVWGLSFILALLCKKQYLWRIQLAVFIILAMLLPLLNIAILWQYSQIKHLIDYYNYVGVDTFFWLFAILAGFIAKNIQPIQQQAAKKIRQKIVQKDNQT